MSFLNLNEHYVHYIVCFYLLTRLPNNTPVRHVLVLATVYRLQ